MLAYYAKRLATKPTNPLVAFKAALGTVKSMSDTAASEVNTMAEEPTPEEERLTKLLPNNPATRRRIYSNLLRIISKSDEAS